MVRYRLRGRIPCVRGSEGAENLAFAAEHPGEAVYRKQTFDAFLQPELAEHLRRRRPVCEQVDPRPASLCL